MKLSGRRIDSFVERPEAGVAAALVFGPDQGLARERADRLVKAVAGGLDDPFRVASVSEAEAADDVDRLAVERSALAFGGGQRAVRVYGVGDRVLPALERALGAAGDGFLVLLAGELTPRSKLRQFCEKSPQVAALPCYADDDQTVRQVVRETLAAEGVTVSGEALDYLTANLGSDRLVSRRELEKLALYMKTPGGKGGEVSLDDARACVGDNGAFSLDQVSHALAAGDLAALRRAYQEAVEGDDGPIAVLRNAQRLFQRLHLAAAAVAQGQSVDQVVDGLRPPLFFKDKPIYAKALRNWPRGRLGTALEILTDAERACKSGQGPDVAICERALMRLARLGG